MHPALDHSRNSKISPGWHCKALQIPSKVENRIALAFPFFKTEMLAIVIPTRSLSSVTLIFRLASMTSTLMMIAMEIKWSERGSKARCASEQGLAFWKPLNGQVVLRFQIHGILQNPFERRRRGGHHDGPEADHYPHGHA